MSDAERIAELEEKLEQERAYSRMLEIEMDSIVQRRIDEEVADRVKDEVNRIKMRENQLAAIRESAAKFAFEKEKERMMRGPDRPPTDEELERRKFLDQIQKIKTHYLKNDEHIVAKIGDILS